MRKLFTPVLLVLLLSFSVSVQAQTEEQLRKFLESFPMEETEEAAETEYQPMSVEEMMKLYSTPQEPELPGGIEGWPGAEKFKKWNISVNQPAGTEAKHDGSVDEWSNLTIYLKCSDIDAVMNDLVKQLEAATKQKAKINDKYESHDANGNSITTREYNVTVNVDVSSYWYAVVYQENGFVVVRIGNSVA